MFEGEKTSVFWVGLITLGLASVVLFWTLWSFAGAVSYGYAGIYFRSLVPQCFAGVVFILIGLYMMKSGVKKKEE